MFSNANDNYFWEDINQSYTNNQDKILYVTITISFLPVKQEQAVDPLLSSDWAIVNQLRGSLYCPRNIVMSTHYSAPSVNLTFLIVIDSLYFFQCVWLLKYFFFLIENMLWQLFVSKNIFPYWDYWIIFHILSYNSKFNYSKMYRTRKARGFFFFKANLHPLCNWYWKVSKVLCHNSSLFISILS